ncbi:unnamed protein product [Pocillopora meandrina]|uniref:Nephrocystin-3 n=1 Tax=Pocillopora meandrina TaxID=46732 RepID=A0AAU9Y5G7_9CNID|nr:unnamed protein product [Pocillopora meandrina]
MEYSKEQLNYYRICYVVTDVLTDGLRIIFKQEWDNRYGTTTSGEWKDEPRNGVDFKNKESAQNQKKNSRLLTTMIGGNRAEWDCTMLFYAILYSDCIHSLSPVVKSNVDALRKFRNEDFAHMSEGNLSDLQFQNIIGKVDTAFQALRLSTMKIQEIKNQTSFPTEELKDVLKMVDDLKQELQEKECERQVLEDQLNNDISPFCVLPPKPSHDVTSRDREVAEIMQQLRELKTANKDRLSYLYISGNPGSGKSQLAGLVTERFYKDLPDGTSFVMTINGESPDTVLQSYVAFSRRLKCPEYAVTTTLHSKDLTTNEKITNLRALIGTKIGLYTSWLLVVDNVASLSHVHVHLPEAENEMWARGQLLITTQDSGSIPPASSFNKHISISNGMNLDDVSCLLEKLSGITNKEMEIKVAQALDYQPLALASAATYVREVQQTSNFGWKDYLAKLEAGQRNAMETFLAEVNPSYAKSMTTATTLAVETAMESNKIIHHAFNFLSLCAPQPLSLNIMEDFITSVDKEIQDIEMIRLKIQKCSLLMSERDRTDVYIRVHQVVHNSIKTVAAAHLDDKHNEVVSGVIGSFSRFVEKYISRDNDEFCALINSRHITHLKNLAPELEKYFSKKVISQVDERGFLIENHAMDLDRMSLFCFNHCEYETSRRFINMALDVSIVNENDPGLVIAAICRHMGKVLERLGELSKAKDYYDRALAISLKKLGPDHVHVANSYDGLGIVHARLSDLSQAKDYHDRALAIRLKMFGPDHLDVATCYYNLAIVHERLVDLSQAKDYHDRALAIRLKKLGPDHVHVANSYDGLGIVHARLSDLSQAKDYHDGALAIRLQKLGPNHVHVASSYRSLGIVHARLSDLSQAKDYHDRALAIRLQKLGPDHVHVASSYSSLGIVHEKLGLLSQAKDYHDRALAICLKKLGPDHLDVATCYHNLAIVHERLGDLSQAKDYHDRALAIRLKMFGPDHLDVATCYHNLAIVHEKLGDLSQAKDYHDRALAIRLKMFGPDHLDVATCYHNLAIVHERLGDLSQAKDYHDRTLAIRLKMFGPDHLDVATSYHNLAIVHEKLGDLSQAKDYHDRTLAIRLKMFGPDHLDVATCYHNLAIVHERLGDLSQAKDYHDRALAIRLKMFGPDHLDVATCYHNLAIVHERLGDLSQAKDYHDRALAIRLKKLGPDHVRVAISYDCLGIVHASLGDLSQAKDYHDRALVIRLKKLGPDHVHVATSYHNLAIVHEKLGDLSQAKDYHDCALAIRLKKLGPDHVDVANSYNSLGVIHIKLGDLSQGKDYHDRALAIRLKKL